MSESNGESSVTRWRPRRPFAACGQRRRISPPRSEPGPARARGTRERHRDQAGRQRGVGHQPRVLGFLAGQVVEPVIFDQVRLGDHAERPGGDAGQGGEALGVGRIRAEQFVRQHPLGQVVDPPPPGPPHADDVAGVEQPFHRDLDVRPVPPRAARLGPAQLGRGQRPLGAQPGQHLVAGLLVDLMPADAPGPQRAAAEGEVRPLLDRQHAGRVRPVLEGGGLAGVPVGLLDPLPGHRPEPGVGDQFVRPRQHADRVQLHRADPAEHGGDPRQGPGPGRRAQEPLRAQRHPADLVGGERHLSRGRIHDPQRNRRLRHFPAPDPDRPGRSGEPPEQHGTPVPRPSRTSEEE